LTTLDSLPDAATAVRDQTRAEIAHVQPAAATAPIFDAGYHDVAIRTSRHEHCLEQIGVGFDIQERGK
jgi:hypothetical protein